MNYNLIDSEGFVKYINSDYIGFISIATNKSMSIATISPNREVLTLLPEDTSQTIIVDITKNHNFIEIKSKYENDQIIYYVNPQIIQAVQSFREQTVYIEHYDKITNVHYIQHIKNQLKTKHNKFFIECTINTVDDRQESSIIHDKIKEIKEVELKSSKRTVRNITLHNGFSIHCIESIDDLKNQINSIQKSLFLIKNL